MKQLKTKLIQLTAGRGPAECCWVVAKLLKVLLNEARSHGIEAKVIAEVKGDMNRTLSSAVVALKGEGKPLNDFIATWQGTVQWKGQSPFRKFHKRKNWFVGINALREGEKSMIHEKDIRFEAFRASGPGGQHRNKVCTAVRAIHPASGLTVTASESRSQQQNKKKAKERLLVLIQQKQMDAKKKQLQSGWENHTQLERGNPIRRFKGSPLKELH